MSQELRVIARDEILNLQLPSNPRFSPNGGWVTFEQSSVNSVKDEYVTHLFLAPRQGGELRQLTYVGTQNHGAVFSPDGQKLVFLSNRAYGTQVWILPLDGGEARQLTRLKYGMHHLRVSPDGRTIYGLLSIHPDHGIEIYPAEMSEQDAKLDRDSAKKAFAENPKHYDWLYTKRDGQGLLDNRFTQLVAIDVETGDIRQLTTGPFHIGEPSLTPDGSRLVFASNRREDKELSLWSDVYSLSVNGGELQLLTSEVNASQVTVSPDGQTVAIFGDKRAHGTASHAQLYTIAITGGMLHNLTSTFPDALGNYGMSDMRSHDYTPGPLWSADGQWLHTLVTREARTELVRFHTTERIHEVVVGGDREIYSYAFDGDQSLALAYTTPDCPGKIVTVEDRVTAVQSFVPRAVHDRMDERRKPLYPLDEVRIDNANQIFEATVIVQQPEAFWYDSADGWRMHGFVLRPANFDESKTYPVILEIHGGPHAAYSYSFFHEMQWLCAQGFAVVYVNPRGSMSYGQEFVDACRGDYGGKDATDILQGLDAALARYSFLDAGRVAVMGGSYGGFMTNWLVSHTNRFYAAVSMRSISNWISFYGVSDIGPFFTESEQQGTVMSDFEKLWKHSPLAYANQVETPILLIHGENDDRCPIEQAEQFYTVLKRLGKKAEFFRIPNASHDLSRTGKPSLRIARLQVIADFVTKHLPV